MTTLRRCDESANGFDPGHTVRNRNRGTDSLEQAQIIFIVGDVNNIIYIYPDLGYSFFKHRKLVFDADKAEINA